MPAVAGPEPIEVTPAVRTRVLVGRDECVLGTTPAHASQQRPALTLSRRVLAQGRGRNDSHRHRRRGVRHMCVKSPLPGMALRVVMTAHPSTDRALLVALRLQAVWHSIEIGDRLHAGPIATWSHPFRSRSS